MASFRLYGDHSSPLMTASIGTAFVALAFYFLYSWLLPKPLPGIAYNPEATRSLWGDVPALNQYLSANGEFSSWLGEQCLKLSSPVVQIFIHPFRMPWILVADFDEAQDILMRRNDFEKPQFLIDGLAALDDFHARYKTADERFRSRRQLRQDLMAPKFLNNYIGPFAHHKGLELVRLFETKARLANGRPFRMREDYARAVLDLMLYHAFGPENYDESAMAPQLELMEKTAPAFIPKGAVDEPVPFAEAPRSFFLELLHETAEIMERTTISPTPQLSFWWWSNQQWFKKIVGERHRVMADILKKAAARVEAGKIESALEHMMMREKMAAEKQGRPARLVSQNMSDEVRRQSRSPVGFIDANQQHRCSPIP